jgi:endogenous inhibitor of DNA gyrase (YacG/DUF329 family)
MAMTRYPNTPCHECGRGLTWVEIAFGSAHDQVCGGCLIRRRKTAECRYCGKPIPVGDTEYCSVTCFGLMTGYRDANSGVVDE